MAKNSPAVRQSQQVAPATRDTIKLLESDNARNEIAMALGGDPSRIIRAAKSYWLHAPDPERMQSVTPQSFVTACIDAAAAGLMPDGKEGHIVPRGNRAVWSPSWRGLLKLIRRASSILEVNAEVVYESERRAGAYVVEYGQERKLYHKPYHVLGIPLGARGSVIAAYMTAIVQGAPRVFFHVADEDRLDRARKASGDPRVDAPSAVWLRHPAPMSRKTAIRDGVEFLPLPDPIRDLLNRQFSADDEEGPTLTVAAIDPAHAAPTGDTRVGWNGGQTTAEGIRQRAPKRTAEPAPAPVETTAREPGEDEDVGLFDDVNAEGGASEAP